MPGRDDPVDVPSNSNSVGLRAAVPWRTRASKALSTPPCSGSAVSVSNSAESWRSIAVRSYRMLRFGRDRQHAALVQQVPAPAGFAAIQLLATLEHRLDDVVAVVPHADDVTRQQRVDRRLAYLRRDFVGIECAAWRDSNGRTWASGRRQRFLMNTELSMARRGRAHLPRRAGGRRRRSSRAAGRRASVRALIPAPESPSHGCSRSASCPQTACSASAASAARTRRTHLGQARLAEQPRLHVADVVARLAAAVETRRADAHQGESIEEVSSLPALRIGETCRGQGHCQADTDDSDSQLPSQRADPSP